VTLFPYTTLFRSHAELGAYLLGLWGLPQTVVEAVAYHHFPAKIVTQKFGICSALHIANGLYYKETSVDTGKGYEEFLDIQYIQKLNVTQSLNGWAMLTRNLLQNTGIL
jgi:HD-like signal output (HDOD) protein